MIDDEDNIDTFAQDPSMASWTGKQTIQQITKKCLALETMNSGIRQSSMNKSSSSDSFTNTSPISIQGYLEACKVTIPLYEHLFGKGSFIGKLLGRTTTRHINCVARVTIENSTTETTPKLSSSPLSVIVPSSHHPSATTIDLTLLTSSSFSLQGLLIHERETMGYENIRKNRLSACHTTLWLNRGLSFLQVLMEFMVDDTNGISHNPRACASAAYQQTLRPYHSLILSGLFRAAVSFAPTDRKVMFLAFGWSDEQRGKNDVLACALAMKPVTQRVQNFLALEKLDFPDKVGTPLSSKKH